MALVEQQTKFAYGSVRPESNFQMNKPIISILVVIKKIWHGAALLSIGFLLGCFVTKWKEQSEITSMGSKNKDAIFYLTQKNQNLDKDDRIMLHLELPETCDELMLLLGPAYCDPTGHTRTLQINGMKLVYYIYGPLINETTKPPLVAINGGPGATHNYMLPLKQQACYGRSVIFYDQVGTGQSSKPDVKLAPWLLEVEYYVEELRSLISHLGAPKVAVLGHSWGGVVAALYAISNPPELASLILSSTISDSQLYLKSQIKNNLATLPPHMLDYILAKEVNQLYDEQYDQLAKHLTSLFTIRTFPIPECVSVSLERLNQEIYVAMQGQSEFTLHGILGDFNITGSLHKIVVPTLVTHGLFDTITPPVVEAFTSQITGSQLRTYLHSGHMTMVDDVESFNSDIADFLQSSEN